MESPRVLGLVLTCLPLQPHCCVVNHVELLGVIELEESPMDDFTVVQRVCALVQGGEDLRAVSRQGGQGLGLVVLTHPALHIRLVFQYLQDLLRSNLLQEHVHPEYRVFNVLLVGEHSVVLYLLPDNAEALRRALFLQQLVEQRSSMCSKTMLNLTCLGLAFTASSLKLDLH